jgi:hypothetical protein
MLESLPLALMKGSGLRHCVGCACLDGLAFLHQCWCLLIVKKVVPMLSLIKDKTLNLQ